MADSLKVPNNSFTKEQGVTLKEFFEAKVVASEAKADARFLAMEKAVDIATKTMEFRLEGMNEFRAQLTAQALTFLSRGEYSLQHQSLTDKMDAWVKVFTDKHDELKNFLDTSKVEIYARLDAKAAEMEKRVQGVELLKAEINGRLWTLGIVMAILIIVLEVAFKILYKG